MRCGYEQDLCIYIRYLDGLYAYTTLHIHIHAHSHVSRTYKQPFFALSRNTWVYVTREKKTVL